MKQRFRGGILLAVWGALTIAVSAVTSETMENSGASDIRALTQLSPSLLVSSTSSEAAA